MDTPALSSGVPRSRETNFAMIPPPANPVKSPKRARRAATASSVTILARDQLARHPLPGRIIQKAVGKDGASSSSRMTMGFARYSAASGPMEPHHHAEEIVYILEACNGWCRHGPAKDNLPNRVALSAGMILHIPSLEWHVFEYDAGGAIDVVFFYGQVDNIRPEEIASKSTAS